MAEPSYEELKAVGGARKAGRQPANRSARFPRRRKGGVSVYGLGRFRSRCITSSGHGAGCQHATSRFLEENKAGGQTQAQEK